MAEGGSNKKIANRLVVASCAAVLAVYVAGYARTQSAADRLAAQVASERRAGAPVSSIAAFTLPEVQRMASRAPASGRFPAASDPASKPSLVAAERVPTHVPATAEVPRDAEPLPADAPEPSLPVTQVTTQVAVPVIIPAGAPIAPAVEPVAPAPAAPVWKDGTYTGWGYSRHGNIEAAVVIERGRIASATISQCRTRYSCSVIDKLIPQVAQRQSPDVDYVSGATQSADAFYGAVVEALSKAK